MSENEPVAELIAMLDAAVPTVQGAIFDHTPEEIGLHVMENVWVILAALRRPAREEVSGEEVKFAETVRDELKERARAYSHLSVEREHFDRAILAISGLLRAAMNPKPVEEYGECTECGRVGTFAVISDAFSLCGACALKPADHSGDANDMIPAVDVAAMREVIKIVEAAMLKDDGGISKGYGWSITTLNDVRPLIAALPEGGA